LTVKSREVYPNFLRTMRPITCHHGRLQELQSWKDLEESRGRIFSSGLPAVDGVLPGGGLARGAVHEIVGEAGAGMPIFFAMLLARAAAEGGGAIAWCDPTGVVYGPALVKAGIGLERVYFLRPGTPRDLVWAMTESLRCAGVSAVVGMPGVLTRIVARRLQLAAETGGGTGLIVRMMPRGGRSLPPHYAAATRWVVGPARGEPMVQRWRIRLVHCHGGGVEKQILLEHCRGTNSVRAVVELADGLDRPQTAGA
jgi:protein ImuA